MNVWSWEKSKLPRSLLKQPECGRGQTEQSVSTSRRKETIYNQNSFLINCQFQRHSSLHSPVLLLVESTRGLRGWGAQESSISFSLVSVCILIIPLEIQLPCTIVTVVYCLRFCFWQHSFHYQCLPILFSVWYFEEVRAIRVTTKLSTLTRFEEAHLLIIRRNIKWRGFSLWVQELKLLGAEVEFWTSMWIACTNLVFMDFLFENITRLLRRQCQQ